VYQYYFSPLQQKYGVSAHSFSSLHQIVSELISGRVNTTGREKMLWFEFKKDMRRNDLSKWIYNLGVIKDRPADLGYYIGYKICETYYNHMSDKRKAIKNIIEMKDFEKFLDDEQIR
jgi:hypothetical protein